MGVISWVESYGDEMFMNFNMSKLKLDEAYLNITNKASGNVDLYGLFTECHDCQFTKEPIELTNGSVVINTHFEKIYRVISKRDNVTCHIDSNIGEFGVYNLEITDSGCTFSTLKEAVNIYFPMLTVFLIYILLSVITVSIINVWKVYVQKLDRPVTSDDAFLNKKQSSRLKSLDTFRGISIVFMLFANFGCGGYQVLEHTVWNGLQFSDLVFPWFMWIMGVCIPISTSSLQKKGISKKEALLNVLKRSCILFALGIFLSSGKYLDKLRIFGVLQRFGVAYFVVASSCIIFSNDLHPSEKGNTITRSLLDIIAMRCQWILALVILIIHNLCTFLISAPDCPTGYLGPGGNHKLGKYFNCTGGATGYIDEIILGNHIYHGNSIKDIYQGKTLDPEGLLGCLTSIIQVIIGAQAGAIILLYKSDKSRIFRWSIWAIILGLLGGLLCGFSKEDGFIPINKNLWSFSFVLVTSSFAFILLSICYYLIDVQDYWSGKPFLFAGMNSIIMYVGHSLAFNNFPIRWVPNYNDGLQTHFLQLLENVWATNAWILIAYYLYTRKIFYSI